MKLRNAYENYYGKLLKGWTIHCVNGDRNDLSPDNLIALPSNLRDYVTKLQRHFHIRFSRTQLAALHKDLVEEQTAINANIRKLKDQLSALERERADIGKVALNRLLDQIIRG